MIKRDGAQPSLWQSTVQPWNNASIQPVDRSVDVVIVGGGITGVSTALLLQEAGLHCVLLEAQNLGFGTTGGTTAHLNTLLDTPYSTIRKNFNAGVAQQVAEASKAAIDLIKNNIDRLSIDCGFKNQDAFLFSQDEKQDKELDDIAEATIDAGLPVEFTTELPFASSFLRAIRVGKQGKFHPLRYVHALATAFVAAGGSVVENCRVTNLHSGSPLKIDTIQGIFTADKIIYATHIPPGVNLLHLRCAPFRSYAMAVELKDDRYPDNLTYDMFDPYHYYRSQEIDGKTFLIAGGKDHKTGTGDNMAFHFTELEATIRKQFDIASIANKWSSQYFEPADGLPYIGRLPGHDENVLVATGFGGNGMTYSSIAAMVLRSIVTNESNAAIDPSLFNPGRIKPVAGFTNFITHNLDAARNYLGKLSRTEHLHEVSDLANGEARVVKVEKERMGIYRDETGNLHAVNTTCTHLKCDIKWNNAELSWDCPCHGARFSFDGAVLTGPADLPLSQPEIESADE